MTVQERADSYARAFPRYPPMHVVQEASLPVAYGRWLIGRNFSNLSKYYGAYPRSYLQRVEAMFPDVFGALDELANDRPRVLHAFSGSLGPGHYDRCDIRQDAEYRCDVVDLPQIAGRTWDLVIADPPYSAEDAKKYGTKMPNRGAVMRTFASLVPVGGHVVWLDTMTPIYRRDQWRVIAQIALTRSTNNRVRDVTMFERVISA